MASLAANTTSPLGRRRLAPPALTMGLMDSYQTPAESFPDTPEPWSTMAGGAYASAPKAPSLAPDFGLAQPSQLTASQHTEQVRHPAGQSRLAVPEERRGADARDSVAAAAATKATLAKAKSKLLTVRNTFIDVGLPSPMPQLRQAHSCPGSRLVTPQSCKSGRLLSPLHDTSVESSAVSTVDTEEATQPKELPSCEQIAEFSPPPPAFDVTISTFELPRDMYEAPPVYEAPLSCTMPPPHYDMGPTFAAPHAFDAGHRGYGMQQQLQAPQQQPPFEQQPGQYVWNEAGYASQPPPAQHPACSSTSMPWSSEPLPTLLTAPSQPAPPPMKPILQLDKILPVTGPVTGPVAGSGYPEATQRILGSPQLPTIGSAGHGVSECKPCAFYWKPQGCGNGVHCSFCHLCDSGEKKRRAKEKRVAMRMAKANGLLM